MAWLDFIAVLRLILVGVLMAEFDLKMYLVWSLILILNYSLNSTSALKIEKIYLRSIVFGDKE